MSEALFKQAEYRLAVARRAFADAQYAYVVCLSQETVEFALKGLLRGVGITYPKVRDVGEALLINRDLFNKIQDELEELASISAELNRLRSLAEYGDEAKAVPSVKLFDKRDAVKSLAKAEKVLNVTRTGLG